MFLPGRLSADSKSPLELLQRAQELLQQGDLAGARNLLNQGVKEYPAEPAFYNFLGVVEAQQSNYSAAEAQFKKAIQRAPRYAGALLNLGRLYQENPSKDPAALEKALETYQRLLKNEPGNLEGNYQSAVLLQLRGDYKASRDHLSRLPSAEQERTQALGVRLANHAGLKERDQAGEVAARLLARPDLTEADVLSILPNLETCQQRELEVRLLEGLDQRKLNSSKTLHQLGLLYENQGQLDRARDTLERVAQGHPITVPLLLELARIAYKQQDHKGALGYLAHGRDLEPQNAGIHFFFGIVCVEQDLQLEADKSLRQAVKLDSSNPYYNYAAGAVAVMGRDPSEAIPYFKKYCELKPEDPRGRLALGAAYFHSSDYERARRELESLVKIPETASTAHFYLGRVFKQEGNLTGAQRELEASVQANPKNVGSWSELGLVLIRQKEYAQAEKALQRALEIDLESYAANLNLLNLYQRTKDPRSEAQSERFELIKKKRSERDQTLFRTIEIQPY